MGSSPTRSTILKKMKNNLVVKKVLLPLSLNTKKQHVQDTTYGAGNGYYQSGGGEGSQLPGDII